MLEVYVIVYDPTGAIGGVKLGPSPDGPAAIKRMAEGNSAEWSLVSMVGMDTEAGKGPAEVPVSVHRQGNTLAAPPHPVIPMTDLARSVYGPGYTHPALEELEDEAEREEAEARDPRYL